MPGSWDTKNNHRDYRIARYQFVVQTVATTPNIVGVVSNCAQYSQRNATIYNRVCKRTRDHKYITGLHASGVTYYEALKSSYELV